MDRDLLLRGEQLSLADTKILQRFCLRNLFIRGEDVAIARIIQNYFDGVRARWPIAWDDFSQGAVLNKTNGFRALTGIFGRVYTFIAAPGDMVARGKFEEIFKRSQFKDRDFNTDNFKPGTSGEAKLRRELLEQLDIPTDT